MQAICIPPATPHRSVMSPTSYSHAPLHSSPLASPTSSPISSAQARRRSQYKANAWSSPDSRRASGSSARRSSGNFVQGSSSGATATPTEEAPRKTFLRDRLRARCIERANKKRERAIARGSRHMSSEPSSDGYDDFMDEDDEDEETMLNDELFSRIVASARRKDRHSYNVSYAYDVGSSFDPAMEDPQDWEEELRDLSSIHTEPQDLSDEELAAYAAEAELNLDDLPLDEIFSYSDLEDGGPLDDDVTMN